jgi:hypothetical protein
MVQQVRLLNNILLLLSIGVAGCNNRPANPAVNSMAVLNSNDIGLANVNGSMYFNRQPFSGLLFTLFAGTKDTAEISAWSQGKEHGEWKKFYKAGRSQSNRTFENGKKTGVLITWWPDGTKQMHYLFHNDEYDGTCREWNEQGKLVKEMNYKMGHEEGSQRSWYDNGSTRANYVIKNGRRFGLLGTKNCMNVSDSIFK